jgi:hypothetical protein
MKYDVSDCCLTPIQQYFSYIMATSFSGGGSWSTRREPPTMGKQLENFITCNIASTNLDMIKNLQHLHMNKKCYAYKT